MSVPRLFYCTVAGLVIAIGLSFLFGASGLFNYYHLRAYEAHVADGIAALQSRHGSLQQRVAVLRDNPEALRLLAREAGYFRAGETVIEVGPVPVDPTAAAGARPEGKFADVAPLRQYTPPAPREPFNALALGLFLGAGSFAVLSLLRALRRRGHIGAAPGTGDPPNRVSRRASRAPRPPAARPGAADSVARPSSSAPPPASAPPGDPAGETSATRDRTTPAKPAEAGEPGLEPAGRRRRARRRRRDVTVYRL